MFHRVMKSCVMVVTITCFFFGCAQSTPNYYFDRGLSKRRLRNHKGAIQDLTKAIKLNPKFTKAYYNRGVSKHFIGSHTKAMHDFTKAIELNPKFA